MASELSRNKATLEQLPADVDASSWPKVKLLKLKLVNFGIHKNVEIDLSGSSPGGVVPMVCLVGPNGTGKTTVLNAVQLLFTNFEAYTPERYRQMMIRYVRNNHLMSPGEQEDANFSVEGLLHDGTGTYTMVVGRQEKPTKHPDAVQEHLHYYFHFARFDQELHLFQLKRSRWPMFQELFEAITGFAVEEDVDTFSQTADRRMGKIIEQYVLGYTIDKPGGKIDNRQSSAGERKIAKCFSTILNKPVLPSVIAIDNVTDHIETGRHITVVREMEKCFSNSQILSTCHSMPIQRNFPSRDMVLDMRVLTGTNEVRTEPWRLRLCDEIRDIQEKLANLCDASVANGVVDRGDHLIAALLNTQSLSESAVADEASEYAGEAYKVICSDRVRHFPVRLCSSA